MLKQLIIWSVIANTTLPPPPLVQTIKKTEVMLTATLQIRTCEAMAALSPALHIRRVTWHTMILPCAGGEGLERREWVGGGSTRREVSILQMGKMAISTQVPSATSFLLFFCRMRRGTPLWLDFSWSSCSLTREEWGQPLRDVCPPTWSPFNGTRLISRR